MRVISLPCLTMVALLVSCRAPAPSQRADPESRRAPSAGEVVGFTGAYGSHVWLGIPYAKPPVGELRWRAPQAPERWSGVREALAAGNPCPQFPSRFAGIEAKDGDRPVGDEDCLYLNVHAPRSSPDDVSRGGARLPVMFWIHGGGNVIGQAAFYDGGDLAATHRVVVVALNYRLGPLGWFRHASLRAEGGDELDRSGNYGTLDLVRGLEWVRDNVAAFGGDPGNVTIFGESAGARDVFSLLISPKARGLFHRAIVQSGGTGTMPVETGESLADSTPGGHRNSSNETLLRLLRASGRAGTRTEAKQAFERMQPREIRKTLRETSAHDLLAVYRTEDQEGLIDVPQLFRDGVVLPADDPLKVLGAGAHHRVPTIFGTNRDENKLFLAVNREYVRWILGVLPLMRDRARYEATSRHLARHWKARGADRPARLMHAVEPDSVWVYRFDWDEEPSILGVVSVSKLLGAAHGFEIPFVFGHWDLGSQSDLFFDERNEPARVELSRKMMSYWTAFARDGDPGAGVGGDLVRWEPFDDEGRFVVFDTESDGGVRMEKGLVTMEDVLAAVDRDPDLTTQEAKCDVYRRLVEWGNEPKRDRYPMLGEKGCAEYPLPEPKID